MNIFEFKERTLNRPTPRLVNVTFRSTHKRCCDDDDWIDMPPYEWIDIRPYEWIDPKIWRMFMGMVVCFDAEPGAEGDMEEAEKHIARVAPEVAVFVYPTKVVRYMGGKREEYRLDQVRD